MNPNPDQSPNTPLNDNQNSGSNANNGDGIGSPVLAYTANGNHEAHAVVTWLESNGVKAHAVEDNSGVSLFAFGTISQIHKPQVFVSESDYARAESLIQVFESQRDARRKEVENAPPITSECEECGAESDFPASQDGTTQNCPKCYAFMDVGTLGWPEDFDFGEDEIESPIIDDVEEAMDIAAQLDNSGEWDAAILAYQDIADRWPEHAHYVANCITEVQRKLDQIR